MGNENLSCPRCGSPERKRDGVVLSARKPDGLQRWTCKNCGRSYVESYQKPPVPEAHRVIAARLLALDTAPMVVAAALDVSSQWVYELRKGLYERYGDDLVGII